MFDIATDIQPISYFKRHTPEALRRLKKTGRPMILTIDGKAEAMVIGKKECREYLQYKERAEMLAFLQESHNDIAAGRTRPMREALDDIAKKHGLRRPHHKKS